MQAKFQPDRSRFELISLYRKLLTALILLYSDAVVQSTIGLALTVVYFGLVVGVKPFRVDHYQLDLSLPSGGAARTWYALYVPHKLELLSTLMIGVAQALGVVLAVDTPAEDSVTFRAVGVIFVLVVAVAVCAFIASLVLMRYRAPAGGRAAHSSAAAPSAFARRDFRKLLDSGSVRLRCAACNRFLKVEYMSCVFCGDRKPSRWTRTAKRSACMTQM